MASRIGLVLLAAHLVACSSLLGADWEGRLRSDAGDVGGPADGGIPGDTPGDDRDARAAGHAESGARAESGESGATTDAATDGPPDAPRSSPIGRATAVVAGADHTCAIVGGAIFCWGENAMGQLGTGTEGLQASVPTQVVGIAAGATAIAAWANHTCAVVDGAMLCWGYNGHGQLASGSLADDSIPTPVVVQGLDGTPTAIAAGDGHSCAVVGGALKCWGRNRYGQLGIGESSSTDKRSPQQVNGLTAGVTAVSAGFDVTCAVVNGGAKCWGNGAEVGSRTVSQVLSPVDVFGLTTGVTAVSTGLGFTCAVVTGGLQCWGSNDQHGLGDPTKTLVLQPNAVPTLGIGAELVGANGHACAVVRGAVRCWGPFPGDGSADTTTPVSTAGVLSSGVTALAVGKNHACAIKDGAVWCWGSNTQGKLGVDDATLPDGESRFPVRVSF